MELQNRNTTALTSTSHEQAIAVLLQEGFRRHKQGDLAAAQASYEAILACDAYHFDALQLLGTVFFAKSKFEEALDLLDSALSQRPDVAPVHNNVGSCLKSLGRFNDALESFNRAIDLDQNFADAHYNKANVLRRMGHTAEAMDSFRHALRVEPKYTQALVNLADVLEEASRYEDALSCYNSILEYEEKPSKFLAKRSDLFAKLGRYSDALADLDIAASIDPMDPALPFKKGVIYQELSDTTEAISSFHAALKLKPDFVEAYNNIGAVLSSVGRDKEALGVYNAALSIYQDVGELYFNQANSLRSLGQYEQALESYNRAISIDSENPEYLNNRGVAFHKLNRLSSALSDYEDAIQRNPDYIRAINNQGLAFADTFKFDRALASYNRVIELNPDYAEAYWNKAILYLMHGHYLEGWRLFDWRLRMPGASTKYSFFDKPDWRGEEDISDKRLFIPSEQGLGDLIQFSRYAAMAVEKAGEVILEVPKMLVPVIRTLHPEITLSIKGQKPPEFDVYCPVMSLPYAFRTTLETIPTNGKYLSSDGQKVSLWQEALGPTDKKRVGLVWSGSPKHENDHNRSIPLTELVPLLSDSVEWHSLQKEYRETDLAVLESMPQVSQHQDALVDFSDTAALIECLDLVITVDTSVAHLAGALGKPVWIMLPHVPDYRWLTDRDDSPWYDSVRLYRQQASCNWAPLIERLSADLNEY